MKYDNGEKIEIIFERDPEKIAWGQLGVDIVVDATGKFNSFSALSGGDTGKLEKWVKAELGKMVSESHFQK